MAIAMAMVMTPTTKQVDHFRHQGSPCLDPRPECNVSGSQ